jgi:hypothetical protein
MFNYFLVSSRKKYIAQRPQDTEYISNKEQNH